MACWTVKLSNKYGRGAGGLEARLFPHVFFSLQMRPQLTKAESTGIVHVISFEMLSIDAPHPPPLLLQSKLILALDEKHDAITAPRLPVQTARTNAHTQHNQVPRRKERRSPLSLCCTHTPREATNSPVAAQAIPPTRPGGG